MEEIVFPRNILSFEGQIDKKISSNMMKFLKPKIPKNRGSSHSQYLQGIQIPHLQNGNMKKQEGMGCSQRQTKVEIWII
jgi:hypothetical protein